MEIERDVKIEYGGESEAGLSSGPRNMEQLPAYTDEEVAQALGEVNAAIERLFRRHVNGNGSQPAS
jgi:hypothetical protein